MRRGFIDVSLLSSFYGQPEGVPRMKKSGLKKGGQVQFSNCSALRDPPAPCWKLNLTPLLLIVADCCAASPGRQRYYFAKGTCLVCVFRRCSGGLKGAAHPLVDREKILVYPLALAKVTVFFGLLSPIIGGQVSSNSLLFGR